MLLDEGSVSEKLVQLINTTVSEKCSVLCVIILELFLGTIGYV